jgi:hypothetical protein
MLVMIPKVGGVTIIELVQTMAAMLSPDFSSHSELDSFIIQWLLATFGNSSVQN